MKAFWWLVFLAQWLVYWIAFACMCAAHPAGRYWQRVVRQYHALCMVCVMAVHFCGMAILSRSPPHVGSVHETDVRGAELAELAELRRRMELTRYVLARVEARRGRPVPERCAPEAVRPARRA